MSQEKSWDQWGKSAETETPSGVSGQAAPVGVDEDVLAAWLKSLPPDDPLVPAPQVEDAPVTDLASVDMASLWTASGPVDPFAGLAGGGTPGDEWDLEIDAPPQAPGLGLAAEGALADFALDLGPTAGEPAVPVPPPFGVSPGGPSPEAPFGPPPPEPALPAEALKAPPLRLQIATRNRNYEYEVQGEALIGRPDLTRHIHPEIDLRLDDAVSRRHAKIFVRNGVYMLTDLNSTNGTSHNRQWLQPEVEVPLRTGDEIEVGEWTRIRVVEAPEANA